MLVLITLLACSPPPPPVPSLTPQNAAELLHYDHKADAWLTYIRKQNPGCEYRFQLPDQSGHPAEIGLEHIVWCNARPAPKEFDASVVFLYDKAAQHWTVSNFMS
jgi:hypothetical protein